MSPTVEVRLHNDELMKWPMWISNEIADQPALTPISEELKEDLVAWTRFYRDHTTDVWDSGASAVRYNQMGRALARRVAQELGDGYTVFLDVLEAANETHRWVEVER
jgi:hypothetical protein